MRCPLCETHSELYWRQAVNVHWHLYHFSNDHIDFFKCPECHLIFKDPAVRVNLEREREVYTSHTNSHEEVGYIKHLSGLLDPLAPLLKPRDVGLDFGCGHTPVLARLIKEQGFDCEIFDPFFFPDVKVLTKKFDFITATEVAEHFQEPGREFKVLFSLLREGGKLGLLTKLAPQNIEQFKTWWYHRDPTHVVFYSEKTFNWLAHFYQKNVNYPAKDVTIFY